MGFIYIGKVYESTSLGVYYTSLDSSGTFIFFCAKILV